MHNHQTERNIMHHKAHSYTGCFKNMSFPQSFQCFSFSSFINATNMTVYCIPEISKCSNYFASFYNVPWHAVELKQKKTFSRNTLYVKVMKTNSYAHLTDKGKEKKKKTRQKIMESGNF